MGHASPRAALIYQHAAADRDEAVAKAMSALAPATTKPSPQRATRTSPSDEQLALELE